jgi:outer membrane scaffolding protein for murein synthesis (MipA/OmpV family)
MLAAQPAAAAEKPLWEAGIGLSVLHFPDYRGSDESGAYLIPLPYVVYRGDFLRADRDGVRGQLFDSERIDFDISLGASLPVSSDDNAARVGMPDLDPTIEIGPSLDITLWSTPDRRYKLDLRMPLRYALAIGDGPHDAGWVFSPRINLDLNDVAGLDGWSLGLLAGPMFGSEQNHEYFYSVAPQYASAARPAFDAESGYAGTQFLAAVSKRYKRFWVGAFARLDTLDGASFEDSPLVKSDSYFAAGIGLAWVLGESKRMVEAYD